MAPQIRYSTLSSCFLHHRSGLSVNMAKKALVPINRIQSKILFVRGQKVMLDQDLADLLGVRIY